MKKSLLATTLVSTILMSLSSSALASSTLEVKPMAEPRAMVQGQSSYSLIVKFKDSNVHKSLLSTPETTKMLKKQKMSRSSTMSVSGIETKYNVSRVGTKEYGESKIMSLSNHSDVKVSHVRSLALNADLIEVSDLNGKDIENVLNTLRASGQIEYVVIDLPMKGYSFNDQFYAEGQTYFKNNASNVTQGSGFEYSRNNAVNNLGRKVRVATLDSGILPSEDLIDYSEGYDFVTVSGETRSADPIDHFVNEDGVECSNQHGTAVTSIMLATANNGLGMVGAIDHTKVEHVQARVLGCNAGTTSDIMDAVAWVSGLSVPGVPDISSKVDVINMSLGVYTTTGCDPYSQDIFNQVRELGVSVVIAAGNESLPAYNSVPASCNNIVSVGALEYNGDKAGFSNYGEYVDVSSIGVGIVHAQNLDYVFDGSGSTGTAYFSGSGTSFAAPLVAGTIANLKMTYPDLTPAQLEAIVKSSTVEDDGFSCSEFGCGKGQLLANVAQDAISNVTTISSFNKAHRYEGYNTTEQTTWLTEMDEYVNTCDLVKYTWGNLGTQITDVTYKLHMSESGGDMTLLETVSIPQKVYNLGSNTEIGVQACSGSTCGDIVEMTGVVVKPNACL
jgi:serine protease